MSSLPSDAELGGALKIIFNALACYLTPDAPVATPKATRTAKETLQNPPETTGSDASTTSGESTGGASTSDTGPTSTISTDDFVKQALAFVKEDCKGDDAKIKTLFTKYGVERLGAVPEDKRGAFLADIDALRKEGALV